MVSYETWKLQIVSTLLCFFLKLLASEIKIPLKPLYFHSASSTAGIRVPILGETQVRIMQYALPLFLAAV